MVPAFSTCLSMDLDGMQTVKSDAARIRACVYRSGEIATARIGGRIDMGECHDATMVFGFLSGRRAVTRTGTLGESRRW